MSGRHPAKEELQPKEFVFTQENMELAQKEIAKYPSEKKQSAVKSLLYLAQNQAGGWVPRAAMNHVAEILEMPFIRVYEVATFYTMFNLAPVGEHFIQICGTTPCWLRGSDEITKACSKKLGINLGETTKDNKFTLTEVECLGACANAPMVQINNDFYEDLSPELIEKLLDDLAAGREVKCGSMIGRKSSEPVK